jgi:hypothetical protein
VRHARGAGGTEGDDIDEAGMVGVMQKCAGAERAGRAIKANGGSRRSY